jgi:hypothetical protein
MTQASVNRIVVQALVIVQPPAVVHRLVVQALVGTAPIGGWGVGFVRMGGN